MAVRESEWSTLILRVWLTEDAHLRARLTELDDLRSPERVIAVLGNADDVIEAIRAWLTKVQHAPMTDR